MLAYFTSNFKKDSSKSRGGMPDYLLTFIKPGDNANPHRSHARLFPT